MERSSGGHPPLLSGANKRLASHTLLAGKANNAVELKKVIANATGKTKLQKPLLTPKHCQNRLDWAEAHQQWTMEDWKIPIWSDKTKIN
ncbi:hypothetical protein FRC05_005695 [Tulasnella sp. 425]|nr:hypothetical protein FRC05_005695 [Tulasnella sp. 425]